ncbi:MAG: hypothetical protein Unbinned3891contig1000_93 [Prokaryotic dsDNA virus sp.]|nr:MAG: hypothetical protein Unbinned3891contig1000_93 [Prokaryotic dsDNA virus sp.]
MVRTKGGDISWGLSTFTLAQTKDMTGSGGVSNLWGVYFKPDGLECYVIDTGNDEVRQYTLSSAWDLSTIDATSPDATFDTGTELSEAVPGEVFVSPDGLYVFVAGGGNDGIFRLTLSSAWDLSTASYGGGASDFFDASSQDTSPYGVDLSQDGTQMYIVGNSGDTIEHYTLSTPWDLNTVAHQSSTSTTSPADENSPTGCRINSDGSQLMLVGGGHDRTQLYALSTAYDPTSRGTSVKQSHSAIDGDVRGVYVLPDASALILAGASNDSLFKVTIG